jgi:hypothetical protein
MADFELRPFVTDRPTINGEGLAPEGASLLLPALPCGGNAFVTVMSQRQLDAFTYKPAFIFDRRVQRLDHPDIQETLSTLRAIQRPVAGAKLRNVQQYARYQLDLARGNIVGILPPKILWTPDPVSFVRTGGQICAVLPVDMRAYILDGETGKAAADKAMEQDPQVGQLDVPIVWVYGLPRQFAQQAHHDLNLLGTRPTIPVALNLDQRDPVTSVAKRIATTGPLANRVVMDKRQVSKAEAATGKVMTLSALRGFVLGVALGTRAIGRATAPVHAEEIEDLRELEELASAYARGIVVDKVLGPQLADGSSMLSVGAVQVVLGSLAHDLLRAPIPTSDAIDALGPIIANLREVDWRRGPRWAGIGGKVNPETQAFSVGGSKEYGYAIRRALTDETDAGFSAIRIQSSAGSVGARER